MYDDVGYFLCHQQLYYYGTSLRRTLQRSDTPTQQPIQEIKLALHLTNVF